MAEQYIDHKKIYQYAEDKINLKRDHVTEYRAQVNRLRDSLKAYITEHPDYDLVKMYHSGSVAKGTALKTLNDMDVAIYIRKSANNPSEQQLLTWLQNRLREVYKGKGISEDQIILSTHCVTISFRGTGLDVDVSPVIVEDDDYGYLIKKHSGERVLTNIPLHLKFIRARKDKQPHNYRQTIRLVKWWIRNNKRIDDDFRFKSFMAELICAHLADNGLIMNDYIYALEMFFTYIIRSQLKERVSFSDNYNKSKLPAVSTGIIEIFDPVNPTNNIVAGYSDSDRLKIVEAAHDALDAIHEAKYATTQERAVNCWKKLFGPSFTI